MIARILLIVGALLAVVNGQTNSSSSTGSSGGGVMCGGAGYDLSSLSNLDIFIRVQSGNDLYMYTVHPCGVVSDSLDACDGMICQNSTTIATYDTAQVDWAALDNGVLMLVQDGDSCGGQGPREAEISFICDSSASIPNFLSMTEVSTCHYAGVIRTAAACTPVGSTGPNGVGSDFFSTTCGAGAWDFTRLNSADITGNFNGYNWTVRVCGAVSNPVCSGSQPTSICQSSGSSSWSLADWNAAGGRALYELGNDGINMSMANGANCGASGNRSTITQFVCNAAATTPVMVNAFERYTCEYVIVIQTADVCGTPFSNNGTIIPSSSSGIFVNTSSSSGIFINTSSSSGVFINSSSSSGVFINSSSSSGIFVNGSSSGPMMSSSGVGSSSSTPVIASSSSTGASSSSTGASSSSTGVVVDSSSSGVVVDSSSSIISDSSSTGVVVESSSSVPIFDSSSVFVDSSSSGVENPGPGDLNGASSVSIALAVFVALMSVLASL